MKLLAALTVFTLILTGCTTVAEPEVIKVEAVENAHLISMTEGAPGDWRYRALLIRTPENKVVLVVDLWAPFREGDKSELQFRRQLKGNLSNRSVRLDYGKDSLDVKINVVDQKINIETIVNRGINVIMY